MRNAILLVVVLFAFATLWWLREPSPVGHWRSAEGAAAYTDLYVETLADMPAPQRAFDLRTDFGIVRAYRFAGSNPGAIPLVLLPGRASAVQVWAANMPALLRLGDVYAFDLLGEPGMSVQSRPIRDDADQARWLSQAIAELPEPRLHLVGYSIGGWSAANLARHHPERLASLVLIDPVLVFDDMPIETVIRSIPVALPFTPRSWRDAFNEWTAGGAPVSDDPLARLIESGMAHYALKLPQPTRLPEEALAAFDLPVLAIIAGRSVMLDARKAHATAERSLSRGNVRVYPTASHAIASEYPEEVAQEMEMFFRDRAAASR